MEERTLANRYRLEGAVGQGGMGVVRRAWDLSLERPVAVKLLAAEGDEGARERLVVEARRTAGVRHPSIVEVFDVGEDGADVFVVMELLEGETLSERLKREGRLAPAEAVAIGGQICDALAAAHDAGLVHRDLKPANVFLVRTEDGGARVKLLDFGIAKRMEGGTARTDPSVLVGTIEYMAPEQITGGALDGRADLYALGLTLYRALVGAPAFQGENVAALVHAHLDVAPTPMRERASVPAALDAVVLRLLAKKPEGRHASAREAKAALAASLGAAHDAPSAEPRAATAGGTGAATRALGASSEGGSVFDVAAALDGPSLELDLPAKSAAPRDAAPLVVAPVASLPPPAERSADATHLMRREAPAWLAPLARVPVDLSKRVLGYGLVLLALYHLFFVTRLGVSLVLAVVAALGGLAMWASARYDA